MLTSSFFSGFSTKNKFLFFYILDQIKTKKERNKSWRIAGRTLNKSEKLHLHICTTIKFTFHHKVIHLYPTPQKAAFAPMTSNNSRICVEWKRDARKFPVEGSQSLGKGNSLVCCQGDLNRNQRIARTQVAPQQEQSKHDRMGCSSPLPHLTD